MAETDGTGLMSGVNYLKLHGQSLLKEVSRSFYLTMRVLPRPMREPVSLAYLLARATDTLADSTTLTPEVRLGMLRALRAGVTNEREPESIPEFRPWPPATDHRPLSDHPGEIQLLEAVPDLLAWLRGMDPDDAAAVRWVLDIISQGQILDIERFELGAAPGEMRALETAGDLDDYTYRVAGCVGEFWTRLALRKLPRYTDDRGMEKHLTILGIEFGKGLQLVNILRDFPSDLEKGRCYLPSDELLAAEVTDLTKLRERSGLAEPVWLVWVVRAQEYLARAIEYVLRLRSWRMRFACALPVALGLETLRLAKASRTPEQLPRGVKVPRAEVKRMMLCYLWASRSRGALKREFARLRMEPNG